KLPKRQETLGPTSPIHDWEVERATILSERKESKEKAERLEKELEKERRTYEKNTASLLKEVKLKEAFMEKKLKDVEEQLMSQMLELQHSLDNEKLARHEEITSLKAQHEQILEAQDKKYLRRLTSLQERLNAKDEAYAELLEKLPEYVPETIESLKVAKTKQDTDADSMRESNFNSNHSGTHQQSLEPSQLQAYKVQIEQLETSCAEAQKQSQILKKRLDQITATHDAHVKELTEKFMSEAQHSELTNRAQLQNLQSEHADMLRELTAQHETEKEVWQISQHAVIDELRRQLESEKQE
ncbi:uncharacterized protein B0P05DRAFT_454758, partial [Gilbertella persicaria]|uniref:uncharacterized protein n=1 Tax=Gilbertella persicaria TaxID=101096 RepID=UPI00221EE30E